MICWTLHASPTELTTTLLLLELVLDNVSNPYGRASAKESRTWSLPQYMYHGKMGCAGPCLNISFAVMYAATRIGALRASHLDDLGFARKKLH